MFRTSEISEEESEKRQKILWDILDNYYKQLPDEENQSEEDRIWRMALARMDRRKMDIETEKVDNGIQITFNPKLSPELQKYSQEAQNNSQNTIKYTSLYLWSVNKIENKEFVEHIDRVGINFYEKNIDWKEYRFSDFALINPSVKIHKENK